jgi:iron complex transport system ATP-binding protein
MLNAQNLSIGYSGRMLAADISFTLADGEVIAILGPNGCGKTTLFRTLLGMLPALHGTTLVNGRAIAALTPNILARLIAYVPQISTSFANFSVMEVVEMARTPHLAWYSSPGAKDRAIANGALEELNIGDFAEREFSELSGGEQQLVMIARALASEAKILLMDEPTASLDFGNQFLILDEIAKLKSRGVSVIFTTHDPGHAFRIADRTLTIARSGQIEIGPTSAVLNSASLTVLYGIGIDLIDSHHGPAIVASRGSARPPFGPG